MAVQVPVDPRTADFQERTLRRSALHCASHERIPGTVCISQEAVMFEPEVRHASVQEQGVASNPFFSSLGQQGGGRKVDGFSFQEKGGFTVRSMSRTSKQGVDRQLRVD